MATKPTPPQAILLREMAASGAYAHAEFDRNRHCCRAWGSSLASSPDKVFQVINPATVGVLIKRGWLEKVDHKFVLSQIGRETLAELGGSDFVCDRPAFTADEITDLLRAKYPAPDWVFFPELRFGTGYGRNVDQRIDAWVMHTWPSKQFLKIAFEIKVYRSDFLKELRDPHKRAPALSVSNQFFFIGPRGLMTKHEVPEECGLMEVLSDGTLKIAKDAPHRVTTEPSWQFLASVARRIQNVMEIA